MFLKNKNIIFKIRRSKVTDYAPLSVFLMSSYWQCYVALPHDLQCVIVVFLDHIRLLFKMAAHPLIELSLKPQSIIFQSC